MSNLKSFEAHSEFIRICTIANIISAELYVAQISGLPATISSDLFNWSKFWNMSALTLSASRLWVLALVYRSYKLGEEKMKDPAIYIPIFPLALHLVKCTETLR